LEDTINRTVKLLAAAALATGIAASGTTAAVANDADVIKRGSCSGASDWKVKASPEDGRIEVEGEVDSNRVGQTWRWRILHDGDVSARGTATTTAPSGSFEVRRVLVNSPGSDTIGWRATNPATGETCTGNLVF
jgi:hypothetical protein